MNTGRLIVLIMLIWAVPSQAMAQNPPSWLTTFPTWATVPPSDWTPAEFAARASSEWSKANPLLDAHLSWTREVSIGPYRFFAQTNQGTIAVRDRVLQPDGFGLPHDLCGIITAFDEVLAIAKVSDDPALPWHQSCVAWVGKKANGSYGAQILYLDSSGLLGNSFVYDCPIESSAGEFWAAVGASNGFLYVLDAAQGRIIRFFDTDQDVLPDTRDSSFQVTIPIEQMCPITSFFHDVNNENIILAQPRDRHNRTKSVQQVAGGSYAYADTDGHSPFPGYFGWRLIAGSHSIPLHVIRGCNFIVEHLDAGTWTPISFSLTGEGGNEWQVATLTQPIVAGDSYRISNLTLGHFGDEQTAVAYAAPEIHRVVKEEGLKSVPAGEYVTVLGKNLSSLTAAEYLRHTTDYQIFPLEVKVINDECIQVKIPVEAGLSAGLLRVLRAGPNGGVDMIHLIVHRLG